MPCIFHAVFAHELRDGAGKTRFEIVKSSIGRAFVPCLFTTVTTMVVRGVGHFAHECDSQSWYGALGIGVALIASVILMTVVFFICRTTCTSRNRLGSWAASIKSAAG